MSFAARDQSRPRRIHHQTHTHINAVIHNVHSFMCFNIKHIMPVHVSEKFLYILIFTLVLVVTKCTLFETVLYILSVFSPLSI